MNSYLSWTSCKKKLRGRRCIGILSRLSRRHRRILQELRLAGNRIPIILPDRRRQAWIHLLWIHVRRIDRLHRLAIIFAACRINLSSIWARVACLGHVRMGDVWNRIETRARREEGFSLACVVGHRCIDRLRTVCRGKRWRIARRRRLLWRLLHRREYLLRRVVLRSLKGRMIHGSTDVRVIGWRRMMVRLEETWWRLIAITALKKKYIVKMDLKLLHETLVRKAFNFQNYLCEILYVYKQ